MDHNRQFTRPLLMRITEHGAAFVELLAALDDLDRTFPDLDDEGNAQPITAQK